MTNVQAKQTNNKTAQNVRKYFDVPSYILFLNIFFCSSKWEFWEFLRTCLYQFDVITEMPAIIWVFSHIANILCMLWNTERRLIFWKFKNYCSVFSLRFFYLSNFQKAVLSAYYFSGCFTSLQVTMEYFKGGKQVIIQVVFLAPTLVSLYITAILLIYSSFLFMQRLWRYYNFQFLNLTALFVK